MRGCQDYVEGCCGCCANMRRPRRGLEQALLANTRVGAEVLARGPFGWRALLAWHWRRGGFWDHLLCFWLAPVTLGLSLLLWWRLRGFCCYAGFLDGRPGRVGCLIHPLRIPGGRDWRRHAFPLVPTVRCDCGMLCGALFDERDPPSAEDWYAASLRASRTPRNPHRRRGALKK